MTGTGDGLQVGSTGHPGINVVVLVVELVVDVVVVVVVVVVVAESV